jgi:superfamily I DNA/RNA helicase
VLSKAEVLATPRFLADVRRLPDIQGRRLENTVRLIAEQGVTYGSLRTRSIEGNKDARVRLMDVDDGYRIVAAVEDRTVFLLKVGNHDATIKWGAKATLDEFTKRMAVDPAAVRARKRAESKPSMDALLDVPTSLAEIAASDEVSDLLTDCVDGVLEGWRDGTIEDWMIFLSPVQKRAVQRAVGGPSRVMGGPGTGKSVVGLHRAAGFAREWQGGQKILITSFVNTVPAVMEGLFARLAPDLTWRVAFASVHSLAMRSLGTRRPNPDGEAARKRFGSRLKSNADRHRQLTVGARLSEDYLWDEITRVIEGRGLTKRVEYLGLQRHGRKRPLPAMIRGLIWDLYEEYRAACDNGPEPVADWDRVLQLALDHVRKEPPTERYSAIIVDEAQDISEVGVRFLLELLEGGAGGRIVLVGDAGQRIYPGGYRLSELGLEIRGRSFPMTVCYRSTDEIMQSIGALGHFVSTEEFGEDGLRGLATSTVRSGSRPRLHAFATEAEEVEWLLSELDPDDEDLDATAILTFSNRLVGRWRARLKDAGIGSVGLEDYKGRPLPGVKVGTYHRAKGLEFKRLHLPGLDDSFPTGDRDDPDEMIEKGSLLYVAMSRAKDELDMSYAGKPSIFLDAVRPFVDVTGEQVLSA